MERGTRDKGDTKTARRDNDCGSRGAKVGVFTHGGYEIEMEVSSYSRAADDRTGSMLCSALIVTLHRAHEDDPVM